MPARIQDITFDCRDPHRLAAFWAEVLGFIEDPSHPNLPDDDEVQIIDPAGHHPGLLFIAVPEPKTVKNRVHLDLRPKEPREETVDRLIALGGTIVDDRRAADGTGWVVMADPEGNELCVGRSAAERPDEPGPVDTGERRMPPVRTADERTMLTAMLDWYREGVVRKVDGLAAHHASATPLQSATSIAGLVKHLAVVEDAWFTERFAGEPMPEPWQGVDWTADPDWEFRTARDEPLAELVALYQAACERSRAITEAHELDDLAAQPGRADFTLRWALVHLLEETARHLGHLDVLREHLDGTTGE